MFYTLKVCGSHKSACGAIAFLIVVAKKAALLAVLLYVVCVNIVTNAEICCYILLKMPNENQLSVRACVNVGIHMTAKKIMEKA